MMNPIHVEDAGSLYRLFPGKAADMRMIIPILCVCK